MPILTYPEMQALCARHGVTGELATVLCAGALAESGWDTEATGDNGHSIGLFQLHDQGLGAGLSVAERYDPDVQLRVMGPEYRREYTRWAAQGYTGAALAVQTCLYAERPYEYDVPGSAAAAGYRRAWDHLQNVPAPEAPMHYDPDTPPEFQVQSWACSVRATTWLLRSLGFPVEAGEMQDRMQTAWLVSPEWGLLDGSGAPLAQFLTDGWGLTVERAHPASWEWVAERAGRGPLIMGGAAWNHWVAVRRTEGDALALMNPAPGWMGVQQTLTADAFARLGPFAALWVPVAEAPPVGPEPPAEPSVADLQSQLGYLTHDVAAALQGALDDVRANDVAPSRNMRKWETRRGLYDALAAAIATLRRGGAPEGG